MAHTHTDSDAVAMKPLLILADDLTGAADSAARCRHAGFSAAIFLQPPQPPLPADANALTSDSRHLPAHDAAQRVRAVAAPLADLDARWYKKIDSTLRGNLGSELDALLDLEIGDCAVICPAFPAQGRALIDGSLIAPGVSAQVHLPTLLAAQSRRAVAHLSLAEVRSDSAARRLHEISASGAQLIVADAAQDADLEAVLTAVDAATPKTLLCGSAGLIGAWAAREAKAAARSVPVPQIETSPTKDAACLLVIGSGSSMAQRQIETLLAQRTVTAWTVAPDVTCDGAGDTMLLCLPSPAAGAVLDGPQARALAAQLADAAVQVIKRTAPSSLVLSGGDTAMHVLARLGVERLTVITELLPGMPLCTAVDSQDRAYRIVLKPGSFGTEDTLITLLELIRN
ncbi:MAG: four-carbon acid sugar kinase family protein [Caldilineaceae bacterium]